jgi:methionine-S-sulfoxide reductase
MTEIAIFGAGCFWGVEERFRQLDGVVDTEVGYCGGDYPETDYKQVCSGTTGHAEVVRIEFKPNEISYNELLGIFWTSHNPTTRNRQGPDIGTQYRSAIFYTTEEQRVLAQASMEQFQNDGPFDKPLVTQIIEEINYVKAEEHHQKYLYKSGQAVCGF